jgi:hypothetical protein
MTKNDARESRRSILQDLGAALKAIGAGGLTGSGSIEAFAAAHQCLGRLQAIDELEAFAEACECGRRARFPRPIIETIGMGERRCLILDCDGAAEKGSLYCSKHRHPKAYAGVEIDPLLTPAQVEAAWHAANETDLEEAAEAFESTEVAEDSEESLDAVCEALDRAAERQQGGP